MDGDDSPAYPLLLVPVPQGPSHLLQERMLRRPILRDGFVLPGRKGCQDDPFQGCGTADRALCIPISQWLICVNLF